MSELPGRPPRVDFVVKTLPHEQRTGMSEYFGWMAVCIGNNECSGVGARPVRAALPARRPQRGPPRKIAGRG